MFRRITALTLALLLTFSTTAGYGATSPTNAQNTSTNLMALALKDLGLIAGDQQGLRLGDQLSRAEALVLIIKLQGNQDKLSNTTALSVPLKDVKVGDWYAPYVNYAFNNNIAKGISKDKFAPNAPVTEKQFVKMLISAIGYESDKDFNWNSVETFATKLGYSLQPKPAKGKSPSNFDRSAAFSLSFETLTQKPKNQTMTVLEQLIAINKVDFETLNSPSVASILDAALVKKIMTAQTAKRNSNTTPTIPTTTVPNTTATTGTTQANNTTAPSYTPSPSPGVTAPTNSGSSTSPSQPTTTKNTIDIYYDSSWSEANQFTITFKEALNRESIEQTNAVKVYMTNGPEKIELSINQIQYNPNNKSLTVTVNGSENGKVCRVVFNEQLIKTQNGNPVKFKDPTRLLVAKSTFSINSITANCITLKYEDDFDADSIKSAAEGKIEFYRSKKSVAITRISNDKSLNTLSLHTDTLPDYEIGKIIMPTFTTMKGNYVFKGYTIPFQTASFNYPKVELVESSTNNLINVHYSVDMDRSTVSRINNYELYDGTVAPENRIGILQLNVADEISGSRHVVLRIENMVANKTYLLKIRNMRANYGNEVQETGPYAFKAMSEPSSSKLKMVRTTLDNKIYFNFSEPVEVATATNRNNYSIIKKDGSDLNLSVKAVQYDEEVRAYLLTLDDSAQLTNDQLMIQFDVKNIKDIFGRVLTPNNCKLFGMNWERKQQAEFSNISFTSPGSIKFTANTDLRYNTVTNTSNYKITDIKGNPTPTQITSVIFNPDSKEVFVVFEGKLEMAISYKLVINNIQTLSGVRSAEPISVLFGIQKN